MYERLPVSFLVLLYGFLYANFDSEYHVFDTGGHSLKRAPLPAETVMVRQWALE